VPGSILRRVLARRSGREELLLSQSKFCDTAKQAPRGMRAHYMVWSNKSFLPRLSYNKGTFESVQGLELHGWSDIATRLAPKVASIRRI
jgi:hypothetical protein